MKFGDISNEPAPAIAIRFERILRREEDGALNRTGKAFLESLGNRDFQIIVFTTGSERKTSTYLWKWAIPYSRVCAVDSVLELVAVVQESNVVAYYDTDEDILSKIKERGPKRLEVKLWTLVGNYYREL